MKDEIKMNTKPQAEINTLLYEVAPEPNYETQTKFIIKSRDGLYLTPIFMRDFIEDYIVGIVIFAIIIGFIISWNLFGYRDIDELRTKAPKYLTEQMGYKIIGEQTGFSGGLIYGGSVYYNVTRAENPNLIYEIEVVEWRGEIQSYKPTIINPNVVIEK